MQTYTYQVPLTKGSTKQIQILNEQEELVFTMKRTYPTILHAFFDIWIGRLQFICHFEGRNSLGEKIAHAKTTQPMIKRSVNFLNLDNQTFEARIQDGDMITPTYIIDGPSTQLKVTIDFNNFVQFYESGKVVATIQLHFGLKKESVITINEVATIQNPLFYTIYAQMFYFVGEF